MSDKKKFFIGIDTGKKGAFSIIDENGNLTSFIDMPLFAGQQTNIWEINRIVKNLKQAEHIFIEHCLYMDKMEGLSIESAFEFGKNFMAVLMALIAHDCRFTQITPVEWKKEIGLSRKGKRDSCVLAGLHAPDFKSMFITKDGKLFDGRAESYCIGLAGMQKAGLIEKKEPEENK